MDEDSQPDYMDDPSDLADDRTVTIHIKHMNTQVFFLFFFCFFVFFCFFLFFCFFVFFFLFFLFFFLFLFSFVLRL